MAPITKPKPILGTTFMKAWREHKGVRQQDAADAINVSRELLSKMESAKSPYLQQHVEALATLYGCSPAELISKDPNETMGEKSPETALRLALLSYGVDRSQLDLAVGVVSKFRQPPAAEGQ